MGEILNSGDLFLLKEEYPNLKDSVSVKMLDFMVEAQFGIDFNRLKMPLWLSTEASTFIFLWK